MSLSKCITALIVISALPIAESAEKLTDKNLTLCEEQEDIYFSCPLHNGKIVSVCALGNTSPQKGYVQYRYGARENIEMLYPTEKIPPHDKFFYVDASGGSVVSDLLIFDVVEYTYVLNQTFSSNLMIYKNNEDIFRSSCDAGAFASVSMEARKGVQHKSQFSLTWQ